jgi:ribosome-associated toxin RatA of RatAB toxin-antitoxin module
MHRLEAEVAVDAPAEVLFEALVDLRARAKDVPAFQRVTISNEEEDGFVATMHEHYGGRDVVVISRFRFQRPRSLSYEHLDSPYGTNKGTFTIDDHGSQRILRQVHDTEQDVSPGTDLRSDWLELMSKLLSSIKRDAEARTT